MKATTSKNCIVAACALAAHLLCFNAGVHAQELIGVKWGGVAPTNWNVGTDGLNPQVMENLIKPQTKPIGCL